ncbi:MAG: glycosyltransferase family 39 protein [bacterium]
MKEQKKTGWLLIACGALYGVMSLVIVFYGRLHVDEGYYHLIASLTARGKLPYRDYFYVQTPLYPFIYGIFFQIFGSAFVTARICSTLFGFMTFLVAVGTARKLKGPAAACITASLILVQPYTIYYLTIVKLYAVTGLMLVILVAVLTSKLTDIWRYTLAAIIAAAAISIRVTVAPTLPLIVLIAAFRTKGVQRLKTVGMAFIAGFVVLAATLLPFWMISSETFGYSIFGYHFDKEGFSLLRQIFHRVDVLFKLSALYAVLGVTILTSVFVRLRARLRGVGADAPVIEKWSSGVADAALVIGGVILFHFSSQAPYVHRYLAMTIPALATLAGPEVIRLTHILKPKQISNPGLVWTVIIGIMLVAMGKPETVFQKIGPVAQLRTIASEIEMLTGRDDEILTFNNSLVVEADRRVMPGDEMNVLTYHPDWTRKKCEQFKVLNVDMLKEALQGGRLRAVLITKYSFIGNFPTFYNPGEIGARPEIMYALEKHYFRVRLFPGFGYLGEDAELYLPLNKKTDRENDEFASVAPVLIYQDNE